mgnify:CR=1 FL=1
MPIVIDKPSLWQRLAPHLRGYDGPLAFVVFALCCTGLLIMYSAGYDHGTRFVDHGRNMLIAGTILFVVAQVPPQRIMAFAVPLYAAGVALLLEPAESTRGEVATLAEAPMFEPEDLPIGPHRLSECVRQAAEHLDLPVEHRVLFFRCVDQSLFSRLDRFIDDANRILVDSRVLPDLFVLSPRARARENPWLGLTFRTSKTIVRHRDGRAFFHDGTRLTLADDEQRRELYRLRHRENNEVDFSYPRISYTLSESDLMPPEPGAAPIPATLGEPALQQMERDDG